MLGMNDYLDEIIAKHNKADYGHATRRFDALMDMSPKKIAAKLDMKPQQISQLLKKESIPSI